ncbi:hypothetical protein DFS33DRAFT_1318581 [Desarmillaria ectypa]|nr:hypothetical protein DFS33DRAFT_1318581 [Desarmillaria ectypa]
MRKIGQIFFLPQMVLILNLHHWRRILASHPFLQPVRRCTNFTLARRCKHCRVQIMLKVGGCRLHCARRAYRYTNFERNY